MRNWTVSELGTISSSVSILRSYLAEHPDLRPSLANDTVALPDAIDEILRIDAPLARMELQVLMEEFLCAIDIPVWK